MSEINEMKLCAEISRLYKALKIANDLIDKAKAQGRAEVLASIRQAMPKKKKLNKNSIFTLGQYVVYNNLLSEINAILDKLEKGE